MSTTLFAHLGVSTPKLNGTSGISSIAGLFLFETAPPTEPKFSSLQLLVPFICLSKRTEKGEDGDGDGGGGAEEEDDDDDRDGVGGRPWKTLGEEQEAEDLQRIEETLGENMGEFKTVAAQDMFAVCSFQI